MYKVLLLENIHSIAESFFKSEGFQVESVDKAVDYEFLLKK